MSVAQQLYEGTEIPGQRRFDHVHADRLTTLSEESLQQAKQVILSEYGKEYALIKPRRLPPKPRALKRLTKQSDP